MTIQVKDRASRLYVLAEICRQRNINPNSTAYMGLIIGVCASNFNLPKNKARELAQILTSAYKQDHWQNILGITETKQSPETFEILKPEAPKNTPKQDAIILKGLAKRDTYDGVGRLILKEVQLELGNLTPEEIMETWQNYNTKDTIEQSGNIFLIYWEGKADLKEERTLQPVRWNPQPPTMMGAKDYYVEPVLEKDCEPAGDKVVVGEVLEDTSEAVEDETEDA